MKQSAIVIAAALAATATISNAQSHHGTALVTDVQTIYQQVAGAPQQICDSASATPEKTSGAGLLLGAIAGAALGNQVGGGNGKTIATVLGGIAGATAGDRIEAPSNVKPNCRWVSSYSPRATGYRVNFEYAGVSYTSTTATNREAGSLMPVIVNVTPAN